MYSLLLLLFAASYLISRKVKCPICVGLKSIEDGESCVDHYPGSKRTTLTLLQIDPKHCPNPVIVGRDCVLTS